MLDRSIVDDFKDKAKSLQKKMVLAEGNDERHVVAAGMLQKEGIMKEVILIGDDNTVRDIAKDKNVSLDNGITIIDPKNCANKDAYIVELFHKRQHKGMTLDKAKNLIENESIYTGAAMVALGEVDGMVGGATHSTADMLRATLFLIGVKKGLKTLSSFFLIEPPNKNYIDTACIFSDCGVVPNPTPEQLADITVSAVESYRSFIGVGEPKVALLSFSTKGSAKDPLVDKVYQTKCVLDERGVDFEYDGEMQFDAALVEKVAKSKAPLSKVAGHANVFIFPSLDAGNIGYKIAERFGGCKAIGPILQGAAMPVNDLSRGCSAEDIVAAAAMTAIQ